jgi:hypothetical protein
VLHKGKKNLITLVLLSNGTIQSYDSKVLEAKVKNRATNMVTAGRVLLSKEGVRLAWVPYPYH